MKRVLIFSLAYYPRLVGGAEIAIKEITDRIDQRDIIFDMITLRFDSNLSKFERIGNVNIHRTGFTKDNPEIGDLVLFPLVLNKYLFPFIGFWKARQLNKKYKYDATWSMMANYAGFTALFFKLVYSRIPFLLTLQEGDPIPYIKKRVRFVYPLFAQIFKKADYVQVISHYLAGFARSMGFSGPLEVIPNGVDISNFKLQTADFPLESNTALAEKLKALKRNLNIKEENKIVITTSRLVKKNAVGDIIEALIHLPQNIKLLILGIGPLEDTLKLQVMRYKLQGRVLFLGHVDNSEIPLYLHISNVFARPSLSEGMGNSFIEAMAAGIPVIATQVGGIVDFLKNKETGLFCEVGNPKSIAKKIEILLSNNELRKRVVKNGKELVQKNYDWNLIAEKMKEKVFNTMLS